MNKETLDALNIAIEFELGRTGTPPQGFPPLPEVPGGRYAQQDFHDLEQQLVWPRRILAARGYCVASTTGGLMISPANL